MTSFALNNLWTYLQGLSLSQEDREWLANKLIMDYDIICIKQPVDIFEGLSLSRIIDGFAKKLTVLPKRKIRSARLDEALKKFSGDFGGRVDVMSVAKEFLGKR